jgi:Protein of unknown function (DUF3761)
MARVWVSGEFEGWYRGERAEVAVGNHGKRVYTLRLYRGFLDAPTIIEPPQLENGLFDAPNTIRQPELQITIRNAAKTFTLNDLRIHNWRTAFQTEDQGEVFGTILGTAYGWIDDGRQPPPPPVPAAPQPAMTVRIAKEPQSVTVSAPRISTPAPTSTPNSSVRLHRGSRFGSKHEPLQASAGCAMTLGLGFVGLVALALASPAVLGIIVLIALIVGLALGIRLVVALLAFLSRALTRRDQPAPAPPGTHVGCPSCAKTVTVGDAQCKHCGATFGVAAFASRFQKPRPPARTTCTLRRTVTVALGIVFSIVLLLAVVAVSPPRPSDELLSRPSSASATLEPTASKQSPAAQSVHDPTLQPGPNGAIARCNNGMYAFTDTGSKTCDAGGGVAEWYGAPAQSVDPERVSTLTPHP